MDLDTELKALIDLALQEDGDRDITSEVLFQKGDIREGLMLAKQDGVICGIKFLETIARSCDENMAVEAYVGEGDAVKQRVMVAGFQGEALALLRLERIILNFLTRLSGIATLTSQFVKVVEGTGAVILDTRKTVPGWRFLDKYAVKVGGGVNHRMGLEDIALIKDTHIDLCGGLTNAIRQFLKKESGMPLIVEVRDLNEFRESLEFVKSLNRILLDNFSPHMIKEAAQLASGRILLEASGGITTDNVRDFAETGVHFLSVGALTHSPKGFDLSFKIS